MRTVKTIGIVVGLYGVALIAEVIMAFSSPNYHGGIAYLVVLGTLGFLGPKVGYRWFDCFFAAIPFYGLFYTFRIAHRVALLPNKDWTERTTSA
jgi:hypothetical protein